MSLLKSILKKKEASIKSNDEFWKWFQSNEKKFYDVIRKQRDINKVFFDPLASKLNELRDGYWFLAGMYDDKTAELIITADGVIRNIVFVEELMAVAPTLKNWKFTALKQPSDSANSAIELAGYNFDETTISFYPNENKDYQDEIDLNFIHKDLQEDNRNDIAKGVFLCLDISLGELSAVTDIDVVNIISPKEASKEIIPLGKLKDYLKWRKAEFIEKYDGIRSNTEEGNFSSYEATLKSGNPLVAVMNKDLIEWDSKPSHPWIIILQFNYEGEDNNGMPEQVTYDLMNQIEDVAMQQLKDVDGYLNVGRETANSLREVYFACRDFRKTVKVMEGLIDKYSNRIDINFDVFKDKYWKVLNRYMD
jgi:hypothetical protein